MHDERNVLSFVYDRHSKITAWMADTTETLAGYRDTRCHVPDGSP